MMRMMNKLKAILDRLCSILSKFNKKDNRKWKTNNWIIMIEHLRLLMKEIIKLKLQQELIILVCRKKLFRNKKIYNSWNNKLIWFPYLKDKTIIVINLIIIHQWRLYFLKNWMNQLQKWATNNSKILEINNNKYLQHREALQDKNH